MIRNILIALVFISLNSQLQGQISGTAVFTTGDSIDFNYYENPYRIPKHSIGISPFGPSIELIGFKVHGIYRMTNKLSVRGKLFGLYTIVSKSLPEAARQPLDFQALAEYVIYDKKLNRKTSITLKADKDQVWMTTVPITKRRTISLGGGYSYNTYTEGVSFSSSDYGVDDYGSPLNYRIFSTPFSGFTFNLSYEVHQSYILKSEALPKLTAGYKIKRFYTNISRSFFHEEAPEIYNDGSPYGLSSDVFDTQMRPFYWRLGWEAEYQFRNSNLGLLLGAEVGSNPFVTVVTSQREYSSSYPFLHFTVGLSLGENPWKFTE